MTAAPQIHRSLEVTFVYSPDDGGWYAEEFDFHNERSRVTKNIFPSKQSCQRAVDRSSAMRSVWESWS